MPENVPESDTKRKEKKMAGFNLNDLLNSKSRGAAGQQEVTEEQEDATCDQYRQYRHLFDKLDDWWWLITADSTVNNYARRVDTDGSLNYNYTYRGNIGVRPACTFNSFIEVEEE